MVCGFSTTGGEGFSEEATGFRSDDRGLFSWMPADRFASKFFPSDTFSPLPPSGAAGFRVSEAVGDTPAGRCGSAFATLFSVESIPFPGSDGVTDEECRP